MQTMKSKTSTKPAGEPPAAAEDVVDRLAGLLPAEELQDALKGLEPEEITGPGGFLSRLAGRVIETALGAELTEHLGYPPGQAPPDGVGNHRNGSTPKTVQSELGPVAVNTPRDRAGTFRAAACRQAPDAAGGAGREDSRPLRGRDERP
jgi:putative transposase